MGALITGVPIQIDPVLNSRAAGWVGATNNTPNVAFRFVFKVGSNLYAVLTSGQPLPASQAGGIFKSADGGLTWVRQDSANQPSNGFHLLAEVDQTAGIIYICYDQGGGGSQFPRINTFNCNTDTYGTPVVSAFPWSVSSNNAQLLRQSTGKLYLYYCSGTNNLVYQTFSAGAWSGVQVPVITLMSVLLTYAVDATDKMHLAYKPSFPFNHLVYLPVSSTGVVGSPVTIYSSGFGIGIYGSGNGAILNGDTVCFPYVTGSFESDVRIFLGTPLSAPVWTNEAVDNGAPDFRCTVNDLEIDGSGNLVSFFSVFDAFDGDPDQLWMNTRTGGVWGTSVLVYDAVANFPPESLDPASQYIHTLGAVLINGTWFIVTALETAPGSIEFCTGFALVNPPVPGCPTIYVARQPQPDAPPAPPPPGIPR